MTREQFLLEAKEVLETMTPEERGELLSDIVQLSLSITIKEGASKAVKEAMGEGVN